MKEYIEETNKNKNIEDNQRIAYLEKEKSKIEASIIEKMEIVDKIAKEVGTGNFDSNDIPYKVELDNLEASYVEVYKNRIEKEKKYNEVLEEIEKIKKMSIKGQVDSKLNEDVYYRQIKLDYLSKLSKLKDELENARKGSKEEKTIKEKINNLNKEIETLDIETRKKAEAIVIQSRDYELKLKELTAKQEYQAAKKQEEDLINVLEATRLKYSEISQKILKAQELRTDIAQLKNSLNEINSRISYLIAEMKTPGRVSIAQNANKVYGPAGNDLMKRIAVWFILSFGWITTVVFLYEISDQRIKNPEDIKNALGFSPSWPISHLKNGKFMSTSIYNMTSVTYKAIKSLVITLNKEREKHGSKVAVFNGVKEKSGVTEIILNAAHIMKENCDNVLVLELNTENPVLKEKLKVNEEKLHGLKDFLEGKPLEKCVFKDKDRDIDILFMSELKEIPNKVINDILVKLKEKYDFIFIDSAPVMKSAMTEYLILKADVGVLVVHGNETKHQQLIRAVEIIERLELKSFAVALNWGKVK
jgi:Mrp family chromosome partitioning ATPase